MKTFVLILALYAQDGTTKDYAVDFDLTLENCQSIIDYESSSLPNFAELICVEEFGA